MRLAVAGASGFIGTAFCQDAQRRHLDIVPIASPRLRVADGDHPASAALSWVNGNRAAYTALVRSLTAVDVLVNAAGLAAPDSTDVPALRGANATVPVIHGMAAAEAGVRRMVHVSSSAVQGRRDPLDEKPIMAPLTPYGRSKAEAETALLERKAPVPEEVTVYRPTSVQGAGRAMTRQLVRLANIPMVPVVANGRAPLPVCLINNVAAGLLAVCDARTVADIVLQPWEGMTVGRLWAALGSARHVHVPEALVQSGLRVIYSAGSLLPRAAAIGRRLELITLGQGQKASFLDKTGFICPVGPEGYSDLARHVRCSSG